MTDDFAQAAAQAGLQNLRPSARLPVLFLGHGSPMNAIEDGPYRQSWQALGAELLQTHERPQLIRCAANPAVQGRVKSADGKAVLELACCTRSSCI